MNAAPPGRGVDRRIATIGERPVSWETGRLAEAEGIEPTGPVKSLTGFEGPPDAYEYG